METLLVGCIVAFFLLGMSIQAFVTGLDLINCRTMAMLWNFVLRPFGYEAAVYSCVVHEPLEFGSYRPVRRWKLEINASSPHGDGAGTSNPVEPGSTPGGGAKDA